MSTLKWTNKDFNVFQINGLEQRMDALDSCVRPKFNKLGENFSAFFSSHLGEEFYPHVAKHARRTVNPPNDSWVAFAPYKRGYKALPHFQIGLWSTHLFIVLAIIYEAPQKNLMAERLLANKTLLQQLPDEFIVSGDHMSPAAISLQEAKEEQLEELLIRLRDVKKGEFLVGRHIPKEEAIKMSVKQFQQLTEETFQTLLPIYKIIQGK
ncbi:MULTISPECIES: YktB family protein [unclassified Lysinibacillus]|uniref:YktB family protein n=1 Tax=unclassified Lysinibacillus TaxID=2636778 RepID=UPI0038181234